MNYTVKIKRGLLTDIPTLKSSELGFTTDEKELYIGTENGNFKLSSKKDIESINTQLNDIVQKLTTKKDNLTLVNGWDSSERYAFVTRENDEIDIKIICKNGVVTAGTELCTLQEKYRPSHLLSFIFYVENGVNSITNAILNVGEDGRIMLYNIPEGYNSRATINIHYNVGGN